MQKRRGAASLRSTPGGRHPSYAPGSIQTGWCGQSIFWVEQGLGRIRVYAGQTNHPGTHHENSALFYLQCNVPLIALYPI